MLHHLVTALPVVGVDLIHARVGQGATHNHDRKTPVYESEQRLVSGARFERGDDNSVDAMVKESV